MFPNLFSCFSKVRKCTKRSMPRRPNKNRLGALSVEQLEGREVPANLLWIAPGPAAGNFNVAANWAVMGVPSALNPNVWFGSGAPKVPAANDTLFFGRAIDIYNVPPQPPPIAVLPIAIGTITSANDNIGANFQGFGNITLDASYTGTVTLAAHTWLGNPVSLSATETLSGGILQAPATGEIVTGTFQWKGGTLAGSWQIGNPTGSMNIQWPGLAANSNLTIAAQLTVYGTVNWINGNIIAWPGAGQNQASLVIAPAGKFFITCSCECFALGRIQNWGTFQKKNISGVTSFLALPFLGAGLGKISAEA